MLGVARHLNSNLCLRYNGVLLLLGVARHLNRKTLAYKG